MSLLYCVLSDVQADIEIADLFQDLRDGSILLLLLELFTGTKLVKWRDMYTWQLVLYCALHGL